MVAVETDAARLKVYVSFCGADIGFADKLIQGLQADGRFDISIDPDCTIEEEDWKTLIGTLIADADAVVVVLSPESARSSAWEIECALENSKRIVPVLCRSLGTSSVPVELISLKSVRFEDRSPFQRSFKGLVALLMANNDWVREHTRLLAHARMWERAARSNELLLTGNDVMAAKMWTLSRPDGAPKPTDLHIAYICMSEAVQAARASAAFAARAERDELETLAHLNSQNEGFRRWANQAYMVVGCWLAALALFADWQSAGAMKQIADAKTYSLQSCSSPTVRRELALAVSGVSVKSARCRTVQAGQHVSGCLAEDTQCIPSAQ